MKEKEEESDNIILMKLIGRFLKALYFKYGIESIASDQLIISQLFAENSPHGKEKQETLVINCFIY